MNSQNTPLRNAMPAARPRATGQPNESAIQGVSVGESVPPKFALAFIRPWEFLQGVFLKILLIFP